jgi:hypothetical protein
VLCVCVCLRVAGRVQMFSRACRAGRKPAAAVVQGRGEGSIQDVGVGVGVDY